MKREDLKAFGLNDDQIEKVMAENGKDIQAEQLKTQNAITERDNYKSQSDEAKEQLGKFKDFDPEKMKEEAARIKTELETKNSELQNQLDSQAKKHAAKDYFGNYKFSSEFAKQAAMNEFMSKDLKFEGGKFIGADDVMKEMQETHKDAFVIEDQNNQNNQQNNQQNNYQKPPASWVDPNKNNNQTVQPASLVDALKEKFTTKE